MGRPTAGGLSRLADAWRDISARHAQAVAVLGLVAVVATVWLVLRARSWAPEEAAVVPDPVTAIASVAGPAATVALGTPTPVPWRVHVLGAVAQPGIVELAPGARVADAVAAAGGLTTEADPAELNLAAALADGDQVVIGTVTQPRGEVRSGTGGGGGGGGGSGGGGGGTALINLNTATESELDTLPGVGPVTARAILAWRDQHGRFTSAAELQEVDGIGPKTYAQIEPHVTV